MPSARRLARALVVALAGVACRGGAAEHHAGKPLPLSPEARRTACRATGEVAARGAFGAGPGQFGVGAIGGREPAIAFDVSRDQKSLFVLDARSERIIVFEGPRAARTVELGHGNAEDLMSVGPGALGLLNTSEELFSVVDQDGIKLIADRALPGLFEDADAGGALYRRPDGLWISASNKFIHATDADGRVPESKAPIRPLPFHTVDATPRSVQLVERGGPPMHDVVRKTELRYEEEVLRVFGLDFDADGNRYVTTAHRVPGSTLAHRHLVTIVSPAASVLRRLELEPSTGVYRTRRPLSVAPDGTIYQLTTDANGVAVRRYVWKGLDANCGSGSREIGGGDRVSP